METNFGDGQDCGTCSSLFNLAGKISSNNESYFLKQMEAQGEYLKGHIAVPAVEALEKYRRQLTKTVE